MARDSTLPGKTFPRGAANTSRVRRVYWSVGETILTAAAAAPMTRERPQERLARLFESQHQRLYRLALRLAHDAEDARDLVQETFLRAARRPGSLPPSDGAGEAFLVRILVNLCRDRFRRLAVRERSAAALRESPVEARAEDGALARDAVRRALAVLTPRRRAVVVLAELEGHSTAEIATLLGIARVTVRWHLAAGRAALERFFEEEGR
jgi:RNA polymerase sigma-70 factor (ECF subfamily)